MSDTAHPHLPHPDRHIPLTTYRLQISPSFTFTDAMGVLDYLVELGVSDVYLSPILQAAPGSTHGYDVVDHRHVNRELGGREAFIALANAAHDRGLKVVVDVVPNHMAVPTPVWHNKAMWSVLKHGHESQFANWFDVELDSPILMPVLGRRIGQVLADQELELVQMVVPTEPEYGEQWVLKYYDHVFPVAKGTESLPLSVLVERQYYRLAHWKVASEELNYRRFFDVGTLAGLRVEREEVFDATHALLLELFHAGHIDAFRVDHPDGLADPREYFRRLSHATGGAWIVAEKILEGEEELPSDWAVAGTTGYDTAWRLGALFSDERAALPLGAVMRDLTGDSPSDLPRLRKDAKTQIVDTSLAAEVRRVASLIWDICQEDLRLRDHTLRGLTDCVRQLIIEMDRYRAYVYPGESASPLSRALVTEAAQRALVDLDEDLVDTMDVIVALTLGDEVGSAGLDRSDERRREVVVRIQQICGAVEAKGVEDTAFYRWTHLLSACEVGSEPEVVGLDIDRFHAFAARLQATWPATMTAGTTHDTKRGEDVRRRISVLTQFPQQWAALVTQMRAETASVRPANLPGRMENLLWQILVGTFSDTDSLSWQRLEQYLVKAMREQKQWTSWTHVNAEAEAEFLEFARAAFESPAVTKLLQQWRELTQQAVCDTIIATKAVQLMLPGVADVYQGSEITATSLVDPDNRRPVDFAYLRKRLQQLSSTAKDNVDDLKLWVTHVALQLRQAFASAFVSAQAGYQPLPTTSTHCLAFARSNDAGPQVVVLAARLTATLENLGGWGSSFVVLPAGEWVDALTGRVFSGDTSLSEVFTHHPVALLTRMETTGDDGLGSPVEA
ncbi:MAG: malto-oligosyltrehalose synthase [Actinomycetaceae bacterium]|nr:malto-oligosyltrehalose synthase [Actinomycetaceae bacterium]